MLSLTSLTLLALTGQAAAWGGLGHRTVGYLAQHLFTEEATKLIHDLLKPTETFDISDAAVWPDTIRMRQPFTEGWHFIGKTSGSCRHSEYCARLMRRNGRRKRQPARELQP
jgi:hypothetical protein